MCIRDSKCTYCAIPMIRGGYRSRTMESIEEEARDLVENGAKELILIAQDTTRYGIDLYGEYSLADVYKRQPVWCAAVSPPKPKAIAFHVRSW